MELAALQGLVDPGDFPELSGRSDTGWRERIGNAVTGQLAMFGGHPEPVPTEPQTVAPESLPGLTPAERDKLVMAMRVSRQAGIIHSPLFQIRCLEKIVRALDGT